MCVTTEMLKTMGGFPRRVRGLDGADSVSVIQPPSWEGKWDGVAVLERRLARRELEMGILEELAEQRLMKSDFAGFRHLGDRVWKVKMHNFRVMIAVLRIQMGGAA